MLPEPNDLQGTLPLFHTRLLYHQHKMTEMASFAGTIQGLLMKHLQYFLDMANDPVRTAKYAPIIGAQASAVLHYGKAGDNDVGSVWYAANSGGSVFQPEATTSGLAAIIADAKVRPRIPGNG